ncbi:CAP domain-containing protein [Actinomadura darangshiensis]|uniref:CAP domain-containing protein n=1 Tax=Actinomadura darangshiensis TaxID=705336 RepID=A0A4R5AYY8_9ACTN|nr:CAP domain-containing protein [Actinomadura darangshiensis]TDD78023.1 CAP domain-containing protein [Actinomadura darangshiensis]
MSNPIPPTGGGPGRPRRRQRTVSGRAAAWTAAGAAGLLVVGGIAGTASGAFDGDSGAAPAASGSSASPGASPLGLPDAAAPSPSATPTAEPTRKKPRKTTKPGTPTPRKSQSRPTKAAPGRPAAAPAGGVAAQVIALVNKERAKQGCRAVTSDGRLTKAAQAHSSDMARRGFFEHTNPDGKDPGDRITAAGFRWSTYGENIAKGQPTPSAVMKAWMNSPGHRANILNCGFAEIGVGVVKSGGPYWTQDFGTAR